MIDSAEKGQWEEADPHIYPSTLIYGFFSALMIDF